MGNRRHQNIRKEERMRKNLVLYVLSAFFCIGVSTAAFGIEGYPGSSWGELSWEIPKKEGDQNLLLQGWFVQGITWAKWGDVNLNTYATIRYKWDSQGFDFNNKVSPGVGVALEILHFKQFHIQTGVEYLWERFYQTGREEQKLWLYTNWYGWWDLRKK